MLVTTPGVEAVSSLLALCSRRVVQVVSSGQSYEISIMMDVIDDDTIDSCAQCGIRQGTASELARDELDFQVNKSCGHKFCKNCLYDIFTNQGKRQFACPRCSSLGRQVMVKREKLSKKSLDSIEVDKDIRIRAKIKEIFNRREEDFPTLTEFNDYE